MFTKEDYSEYFGVIQTKEEHMADFLRNLLSRFKDKAIIEALEAVMRDEVNHATLSKELFKCL